MKVELRPILLVEDDVNDAELTLNALGKYMPPGQVTLVRDGQAALDYLQRRGAHAGRQGTNPAVILLDLNLPKVSGLEVLREVKGDDTLCAIPVVVLTSSREDRDIVESYELGVNAYVVKPVDFHEFADAVKALGMFWAIVNEPPPSIQGGG